MEKHTILESEAEKDVEIGCYNKAVSAFYFALRYLAEILLRRLQWSVPRRDDKLANSIESLGLKNTAKSLRFLYELRKKADYMENSVNKDEVVECLKFYKKGKQELLKRLEKMK